MYTQTEISLPRGKIAVVQLVKSAGPWSDPIKMRGLSNVMVVVGGGGEGGEDTGDAGWDELGLLSSPGRIGLPKASSSPFISSRQGTNKMIHLRDGRYGMRDAGIFGLGARRGRGWLPDVRRKRASGFWTVTLVSDFAQQIRPSLSQIRSSSRTCQTAHPSRNM